jgi:hypothetical protein
MKSALLVLSLLMISNTGLSMNLSYKDHVEVKKTIVATALPVEYIRLHRDFSFEGDRMIAGKFESKKSNKGNYLDGLRSKLEGCKGVYRF